jgi:hypothetical protein
MSQSFKYLNKEMLDKINHISATIFKYNRTIPQSVIDALDPDNLIVVSFSMVHEHIAGKPVDPHMRCMLYAGPDAPQPLIVDMEMGLYDLLPTYTPDSETEEQPTAA